MELPRSLFNKRFGFALLLFVVPCLIVFSIPRGDRAKKKSTDVAGPAVVDAKPFTPSRHAWTLVDAKQMLRRHPHDPYLQYVTLQLARQENQLPQVLTEVPVFAHLRQADLRERVLPESVGVQARMQLGVFLKSIEPKPLFGSEKNLRLEHPKIDWVEPKGPIHPTGALLNTPSLLTGSWPMLGIPFARLAENQAERIGDQVLTKSLPALTWPRQDWAKKLGDAVAPKADSGLAMAVPDDFWFAEFPTAGKLAEVLDLVEASTQWKLLKHAQEARGVNLGDRTARQLLWDRIGEHREFHREVLGGAALVGSDLFLAEGSDVTLLAKVKQPILFQKHWEKVVKKALDTNPNSRRVVGKYMGVEYQGVTTPDRGVSVFGCQPRPNLHVRSNSLPALRKVIEATLGMNEKGDPVARLGDAGDFRFFQNELRVTGAEAGFLFFSEEFLRRQWSPEVQLTQRLRQRGGTHLRMIAHAAQLFRTQTGKAPVSLEDLASAQCSPGVFHQGVLANPFEGTYSLTHKQTTGACSVLGTSAFLTPCIELAAKTVSTTEAKDYEQFLADVRRSPQGLPAPAGFVLHLNARQVRVESLALPALGGTSWNAWADVLESAPASGVDLPVPARVQFSIHVQLRQDKVNSWLKPILAKAGLPSDAWSKLGSTSNLALHAYELPPSARSNDWLPVVAPTQLTPTEIDALTLGNLDAFTKSPMYLAMPVADAKAVDVYLDTLDSALQSTLAESSDFIRLRFGQGAAIRGANLGSGLGRIYWARIGSGFFLASRVEILEEIDDATKRFTTKAKVPASVAPPAALRVEFHVKETAEVVRADAIRQAEAERRACQKNLAMLSAAARAFTATPPVSTQAITAEERARMVRDLAERMNGVECGCPDGGRYILSADGQSYTCSVHGSMDQPTQQLAPGAASLWTRFARRYGDPHLAVTLRDGLVRTTVTIDRRE